LGGAAIGLGYAVPIATGVKWFPDKRGLITGLAVMGFGGSTLVFGPLANTMIANQGVWNTFLQLGIVFFVMVSAGSLLLTTPPSAGSRPADAAGGQDGHGPQIKRDFSPGERRASCLHADRGLRLGHGWPDIMVLPSPIATRVNSTPPLRRG
jgi:OFA family oxalate/formate antiporter-like MFS transporter